MPLLKLWNAWWKGTEAEPSAAGETRPNAAIARESGHAVPDQPPARPESKRLVPPANPAPTRGIFSLGRQVPDAELRRLIADLPVTKVVEAFVGDGSRTQSVLEWLQSRVPDRSVQYTVVDAFEGRGGASSEGNDASATQVSVKAFHRRMRERGLFVRVLPGALETAIPQIAASTGRVDLVLVGSPRDTWATPEVLTKLRRICHPGTLVLSLEVDRWVRCEETVQSNRRAA